MKMLVVYESEYGNTEALAQSFFVEGSEGPLEPGEEDRARSWALHALGRPKPASSSHRIPS